MQTKQLNDLTYIVYSPNGEVKHNRRGIVLVGSGTEIDPPPKGATDDSFLTDLCSQLANSGFVAAVVGYRAGQTNYLPNGDFDLNGWIHNTTQMSDDFNNVLNDVIKLYGGQRNVGVVGGVSYAGFLLAGSLANWGVPPQLADTHGLLLIGAGTGPDIAQNLSVPVLNKIYNKDPESNDGITNLGGSDLYSHLNPQIQSASACETDMSDEGHRVNSAWVPWFIEHIEKWLPALSVPTPKQPIGDTMLAGQGLTPDQRITSQDKRFALIYQMDGNLVLYKIDTTPYVPLWMSGTNGKPLGICIMESSGNLVIYSEGQVIWSSNIRNSTKDSHFIIQNDGNGVIYQPNQKAVWVTSTQLPRAHGNTIRAGEILNVGQSITSTNQQFTLTYQVDGNLVLCKNGLPLWASGTQGQGVGVCIMQEDGNLVIYTADSRAIWASNTNTKPKNSFVLQDDERGVIYQQDGTPIWEIKAP
jgi:hypothetical protein